MTSDRDGRSLRAVLQYENAPWSRHPADAALVVNGRAVGGSVGQTGGNIVLLAPYALQAGANTVEVRLTHEPDVPGGLAKLEVVGLPATMAVPLPGWMRRSLETAGAWTDAALDDRAWEPVGTTPVNDYQRDWVVTPSPRLDEPGTAYRTHLRLTADDLTRIHTLYLRHAAATTLYVNGTPVAPDDEWYYSLNAALHAGDNVLAFTPEPGQYRGLDLPIPANREGKAQMPVLRADRAPLVPADARLGAYRLNRTFPVCAAPRTGKALFSWPNGAPAITLQGTDIAAAPSLLSGLFPAPHLGVVAHHTGGAHSQEYELVTRLLEDGFRGDRKDQLVPALLHTGLGHPVFRELAFADHSIVYRVESPAVLRAVVSWHVLDWQGKRLAAGTQPCDLKAGVTAQRIPYPHEAIRASQSSALGRFVRVRLALLSDDFRTTYAFVDRHIVPTYDVDLTTTLDAKQTGHNALTAPVARRVLHASNGQLTERFIYVPGEPVTVTATVANRLNSDIPGLVVRCTAEPALQGTPITLEKTIALPRAGVVQVPFTLTGAQTRQEQPWTVTVGAALAKPLGENRSKYVCPDVYGTFIVAQPRGALDDMNAVTKDDRSVGGYMWQMTPHAFAIEHRSGTDAQPVDGPWWTKVRQGGDGNWLVAQGIHRGAGDGDQHGLLWGPWYDETRGEIMDSYGWFPNGENVRGWWSPFAMREPLRGAGRRPVVLAMSDWWQYDSGFPQANFATMQMFNAFLVANKGKTIAGKTLDGTPIDAQTLEEMLAIVRRDYRDVYGYFHAAGLARAAAFTDAQLNAVVPGSTQSGQGAYAGTLPATVGGVTLGPQWAAAESQGILDADNHPFAGDWQYGIESTTFRAIGVDNHLLTHWETPMNYHGDRTFAWQNSPLAADRWQRRLLDARWLAIADGTGAFQRVFNTSHEELFMAGLLPNTTRWDIGGGVLPGHWWMKDRLAALGMTVAPAQPLSPLLLVGESRLDWTQYYGILGKLRNAGLTLGGGVSVAQLRALKPSQIPALVWPVAAEVDGALLAAVAEKIAQGVPVLLIGNVPAPIGPGPDLRAALGVRYTTDPAETTGQEAGPVVAAWPEARGLARTPALSASTLNYAAAGITPLVSRNGRLLLGQRGKTVVYAMTPKGLWDQDDPAVLRVAVRALDEAMDRPIGWPDGVGGYAFRGADGATYAVIENLQPVARTVTVRLPAQGKAADLLSGAALPVQAAGNGVEVTIPLAGSGGTLGVR